MVFFRAIFCFALKAMCLSYCFCSSQTGDVEQLTWYMWKYLQYFPAPPFPDEEHTPTSIGGWDSAVHSVGVIPTYTPNKKLIISSYYFYDFNVNQHSTKNSGENLTAIRVNCTCFYWKDLKPCHPNSQMNGDFLFFKEKFRTVWTLQLK